MDNLYTFALYGIVVLGAVVLVLASYAVLTRWLSERRQTRAARLRPLMREAIDGYLDGSVSPEEAEHALAFDRKLGIGVLLAVASVRTREHQLRLRPLAERFGFEQQQLRALSYRNPTARARAAVHLGYLGSDVAGPGLLAALQDEHLDVRLAAAQALVQTGRAVAVVPILRALALPGRWPLQRATELLYGFGNKAIAPLRQLLANHPETLTPATATVAINVLGLLGAHDAAGQIAGWIGHEDVELRVAATRALGCMEEPVVASALTHALRDPAWEVRSMAAKALGKLREPHAIPALERALADPAWWVRCNAAEALAEFGDDGVAALKHALATQEDAFARDISRQLLEERNLVPALEATS